MSKIVNEFLKISLITIFTFFSIKAYSDDLERFNMAVEFLKTACASGEEVLIEAEASGGLSLMKKGGSGSIKISKAELRGMVNTTNDEIRLQDNKDIRECMQPFVQQILNIIASPPKSKEPEGVAVLPKSQWMPVGVPLPILDGKVTVLVSEIGEGNDRKAYSDLRIEVPRRSPYEDTLYNAQNMNFEYQGSMYKLTATTPELQNQRVQITIIKL